MLRPFLPSARPPSALAVDRRPLCRAALAGLP